MWIKLFLSQTSIPQCANHSATVQPFQCSALTSALSQHAKNNFNETNCIIFKHDSTNTNQLCCYRWWYMLKNSWEYNVDEL